nr:DUF3343 domain-containing protein [Tissierella sp.]
MEEYGLTTFKSTQFALQGEIVLKEAGVIFKTIPTPREVSHSCGLSLLFALDDVEKIKAFIKAEKMSIDGLYKYKKENHRAVAEKIL